MTFKMNNDVRKTYSIVCHGAMSKYFVSERDDSDSENPVGVVLQCRRTFQNYCLTFGHLGLRLIPWPHILMYLIVRLLFSLGLWLVSCPQLMRSLHSSEPKLLLLIIQFSFFKTFFLWLSGIRCNYRNFCFFENLAFNFLLIPSSRPSLWICIGTCFLYYLFVLLFPKNKRDFKYRSFRNVVSLRLDIFGIVFSSSISDMYRHSQLWYSVWIVLKTSFYQ